MKSLALYIVFALWIGPACLWAQEDGGEVNIPCFVYHRFGDDRYPSTNISKKDFRSHLEYLKYNDYQVITMNEALDYIKKGERPSKKCVVITVDDGYSSFAEHAMPLLREFDYPATLFINTDHVGYEDFMDWDELRALAEDGIEIGNHSHTHDYFVNYKGSELEKKFIEDLERSEALFKDQLGYVPAIYSYPYGEYIPWMQDVVKEKGYIAAVAQHSGVMSGYSDIYALPRFPVAGTYAGIDNFSHKAQMRCLPVILPTELNPVLSSNTIPEIRIGLAEPKMVLTEQLNCYRSGGVACSVDYDEDEKMILVSSKSQIKERRTKINITAPDRSGNWYWFSLLFIDPSKE